MLKFCDGTNFILIGPSLHADIFTGGPGLLPGQGFMRGGPAMTAERRSAVMSHIRELKAKLEDWRKQPMLDEIVRDIGTRAIRKELTRISRELKLDDVHHRMY
jgi:hypothetical protein